MKIAIDIDNTVFTNNSIIYRFLNNRQHLGSLEDTELKYDKVEKHKTKPSLKNLFPFLNPSKYVAFKDSVDVINLLFDNGHEIVFLSNRPTLLKSSTLKLLDRFKIKYDSLFLGCKNKHLFCTQYGIDVLIDDQEKTCSNAAKTGTRAICFNPTRNTINYDNETFVASLYHARSWHTIEHMVSYMDTFNLFTDGYNVFSEQARENRLVEFFKGIKPLYREMVLSKYAPSHELKPYAKPTTRISTPEEMLRELENRDKIK